MKSTLAFKLLIICALLLAVVSPTFAQQSETLDLSGSWLTLPGDDIHRGADTVKESDWKQTALPASTTAAGFVWYRRHFTVPAEWGDDSLVAQRHELILHVGEFRGAINVYLNGYHVQALGTLPTSDNGTGYIAAPTKSDVELGVATQANVGGQNVELFNYGKDNVIAFQVYTDRAGGGFTGGNLELEKPGFAVFYPYSRVLESDNGLFDSQHPIKFNLTLGNRTNSDIKDTLTIGATDDEGTVPTNFVPPSGPVDINSKTETAITYTLTFAVPGFYTLSVKLNADGKQLPDDDFVVGYNALNIVPTEARPADFRSFWNGVIRDATQPANVIQTTDKSAPNYVFTGIDGQPVDGWLTLPSGATGKVPVIIEFPSYNNDFTGPDTSLTGKGVATLRVNVDQSFVGAGNTPITTGIDDPKTYSFRTMVGNALRCIGSLPPSQFDTSNIGLAGLDEGAYVALAAASLNQSQVKAVFAADPLMALPAHSIKAASSGPYLDLKSHIASNPDSSKTLPYYDLTNLVTTLNSPVYFQIGLLDSVTPPYGIYAVSNAIKSAQTTDVDPNAGHATPTDLSGGLSWLAGQL